MKPTAEAKPSTLAEAVEILRSRYPRDQLAAWAAEPMSEALWTAHFQLGLWIRNSWVYEDSAPLIARIQRVTHLGCPDTVSEYILEALWRVLNGEDCPTIEELLAARFSR